MPWRTNVQRAEEKAAEAGPCTTNLYRENNVFDSLETEAMRIDLPKIASNAVGRGIAA